MYSCDSPTEARWFSLIALPLPFNRIARVAVLHINISSLVRSPFGASFALTANERSRDLILIETQKAANVVHGAVGQSLRSQLNKMLSDQRPGSSIDAIRERRAALNLLG